MSPASPVNQHLTTTADELERKRSTAGRLCGGISLISTDFHNNNKSNNDIDDDDDVGR